MTVQQYKGATAKHLFFAQTRTTFTLSQSLMAKVNDSDLYSAARHEMIVITCASSFYTTRTFVLRDAQPCAATDN